jgi:hypothetical protein
METDGKYLPVGAANVVGVAVCDSRDADVE